MRLLLISNSTQHGTGYLDHCAAAIASFLGTAGKRVAFVPYAVFDRDAFGPIVYLPTYGIPALDEIAVNIYAGAGYRVIPIDVSTMYTMNGSLGCLVNVMARQ